VYVLLFSRVWQLSCGSAHLLGVVLGNVRVGEFLRHGGGNVWCVVRRETKRIEKTEMCQGLRAKVAKSKEEKLSLV
jgi:hypothetical protein